MPQPLPRGTGVEPGNNNGAQPSCAPCTSTTLPGYGWVVDCGVHRRHVRQRWDCPSPCRHCIRRTHAPRQWQHILQYCVVLCSKNGPLETLRCRHATLCQQSGRLGAIISLLFPPLNSAAVNIFPAIKSRENTSENIKFCTFQPHFTRPSMFFAGCRHAAVKTRRFEIDLTSTSTVLTSTGFQPTLFPFFQRISSVRNWKLTRFHHGPGAMHCDCGLRSRQHDTSERKRTTAKQPQAPLADMQHRSPRRASPHAVVVEMTGRSQGPCKSHPGDDECSRLRRC